MCFQCVPVQKLSGNVPRRFFRKAEKDRAETKGWFLPGLVLAKGCELLLPDLPFLAFLEFLAFFFFLLQGIPCIFFFECFSFFLKDFRVSHGKKNPCLFGRFPFYRKSKERKIRAGEGFGVGLR